MISLHHQVEENLKLKYKIRKLFIKTVSNVCSIFVKQSTWVILQLYLKKWFYHEKEPFNPSVMQVVLQKAQVNESIGSQFWKGQTKSYGLLELGTTQELAIDRVSSFNFS